MLVLKKNSKVLLRGINLSGGAPKSAFQYLNVLKNKGCCVSVIAQESEQKLKELYEKSFDKLVITKDLISYHDRHDYVGLYRQLKREYTELKKSRPDLVISLGHFNAPFYAHFCNALGIPNVTLIAGGDLSKSSMLLYKCPTDHVVCFSKENKDVLLNYFEEDRITIISNRIELNEVFNDVKDHYNLRRVDVINILLTSRVSADKYVSIINFIKIVNQVAKEEIKISLTIAGGGALLKNLKEFVNNISNSNFEIIIRGHVDDLIPEFKKAHIVVGKGRSVIEPTMMNRVGCVIGDNGEIEVCMKETFDGLYYYNFSGRNIVRSDSVVKMKNLIYSLINHEFDLLKISETSNLFRYHYSSEFLPDKFQNVLDNLISTKKESNGVCILLMILKLMWCKINQRNVNKAHKYEM